ncbi:MAG: carboxypeptidase-like regulatory domain-containing protein [Candidatus Methylomirabilales bacterium]
MVRPNEKNSNDHKKHPIFIFGSGAVAGVVGTIAIISFIVLPHYVAKTEVEKFVRERGQILLPQSVYDDFRSRLESSNRENRQAELQKVEIYQTLLSKLESYRLEVDQLRARLYTLRADIPRDEQPFQPRVVLGIVESPSGNPIADARVTVRGGSQTYTNSNGEFILKARVGDVLVIETQSEAQEFPVVDLDFKRPKVVSIGR